MQIRGTSGGVRYGPLELRSGGPAAESQFSSWSAVTRATCRVR